MYPKWVQEICTTPCTGCRATPALDDIIAVGAARPAKQEAYLGPLAMLLVVCPNCGGRMYITLREPIQSVIRAMREFARIADEAGRNTPPPFNFGTKARDASAAVTRDGTGPLRPSRRENQPDTPPTQQEIQAFLRRLRKTSFKRGSKGFTNWMKDIGAESGDGDGTYPHSSGSFRSSASVHRIDGRDVPPQCYGRGAD